NVYELCQDVYHDNYNEAPTDVWSAGEFEEDSYSNRIVCRGDSWYFVPGRCRSAYRDYYISDETVNFNIGFRLVSFPPRTLE
ncbi:MAG: SUMF1/EgtB/PvdO family nonheme iron enzyme, partial [Trichodesmium sp. St17_bin3_1_1]|nr:SUMF1/EgtB/PvdO family nonheme iron enzyme [Trichodesmium sp. St17_bin3_1_1]